ncbi:MAG TPA: galactose oxidase early set domain-containing protein [Cytophagales bacterium]
MIVAADPAARYGESFGVRYKYSGEVERVVLVAPGSVTHAFDMHTRHVELAFAPDGPKRLRVTAPPDAHVAPPGYYMLFLLSERGVPSEAAFVRLHG